MGEVKQINIKNRTYYFYNIWLISKILMQGCEKLTKSRPKTLIFTTLDTSQLKKLMVYLCINHASRYIEE